MALHKRLLRDIAELQTDPYPNIELHPRDNLTKACLILTPHEKEPLHLTIVFARDYPLRAPEVTIQSRVSHPNVFNSYICASILNTTEGYTSAYTLKGICIQLLSFFSSDRIEQQGGGYSVDLNEYKNRESRFTSESRICRCSACGFRSKEARLEDEAAPSRYGESQAVTVRLPSSEGRAVTLPLKRGWIEASENSQSMKQKKENKMDIDGTPDTTAVQSTLAKPLPLVDQMLKLPNEILMVILEELDTVSLMAVAKVCPEIAELIASHDFIRLRELQCFCLKENFMKMRLGVGVSVTNRGQQGSLGSEFDLLSWEAFQNHQVRRSVQGLPFQHWLPLPLSRRHWRSVQPLVDPSLTGLAKAARLPPGSDVNFNVICTFMTDLVVKLSNEFALKWSESIKSSLRHASEKAIESYFSLFHLLLCLAVSEPKIVNQANEEVANFLNGETSKESCPNLGRFITLTLISDEGLTPALTIAIIHEAILRNVVWMLDKKGANMPELSYLEPTATSAYRLQRTFEASMTSYRLLMFQALFYKIARPVGTHIEMICNDIFDRHGAPPQGTAERFANEIRHLKTITTFPEFFRIMGVDYESIGSDFPSFLKETITESQRKGYSKMPITQSQAFALRKVAEPDVPCVRGLVPDNRSVRGGLSFFPARGKSGNQRKGGGGR